MTSDDARLERPFGTWDSPVPPAALTAHAVSLSLPVVDRRDTYWLEGRPGDGGRTALVRKRVDGTTEDVLALEDAEVDVRSRVHEYGGAAYTVDRGIVVFSQGDDGRLYRHGVGGSRGGHVRAGDPVTAVPLTPAGPRRFADPVIDLRREVVYAVREDHATGGEPSNELVRVPLDGSAAESGAGVAVLVTGRDFVSSPTLSPDGDRLAWVCWDHPDMPWTSSELHVGGLDAAGDVVDDLRVAGGDGVSVAQPVWTPAGDLVHVDDSTGWWNLYRTEQVATDGRRTRALHPAEAEFTAPQWRMGPRSVAVLDDDHLVCSWAVRGRWRLGTVRLANGELEEWDTGCEPAGDVAAGNGRVAVLAASPTRPPAVVEIVAGEVAVLRTSNDIELDPADVSAAEERTWATPDGAEAHGFFYPPASARFRAPEGQRPPLLVMTHGGPTSATGRTLSVPVQFWTTRGFAVLDVNYGGSTGYGRDYRRRLDGRWGLVDVADCASGATALADDGLVDRERIAIRGGSAGGFTTLAALTFTDVFTAGASYYGIGDLAALARDTHKFESRYLEGLIGPYPAAEEVYRERSPIHHTDRLTAPLVLLQGTEDKVVPPNQAEEMAAAVRAKGLPVALVMFEGEAHGFRRAETIRAAVEAELSFYAQVWGFEPAGDVPVLAVENL